MDSEILSILKENTLAGAIFGGVIALYLIGSFEDKKQHTNNHIPDGLSPDEEIVFLEKRLQVLTMLKEENLSIEDLVLKLHETIVEMEAEMATMKGNSHA